MTIYSRQIVAAFVLAVLQAGAIPAQEENKSEQTVPARPSRSELRDKQLDVSLEARDIERVLTKLKKASELSKTRIAEAAQTAESVSTALDKGDSKGARGDAQQAAEMFKEIIKQLEALLAEETPQRVAAARNLANQLAKMERQFAQQFPGVRNLTQTGGVGKVDPRSETKLANKGQGSGAGGQQKKMEKKDGEGNAGPKNGPRHQQGDDGNSQDKKNDKTGQGDGDGKQQPDKTATEDGEGRGDPKQEPRDGQGGVGTKREKGGDDSKDPLKADGGDSNENDANKDDRDTGSGGSRKELPITEEEKREALARRAEQLAKMGETLKDVLQTISQSNDPADKEAVAKLEAILNETDLLKAIDAMQQEAELIRSDKLDDARLASLDLADRLEITAQRLDGAYRAIIAPQAEELRKLEQALVDLREKLENLETQAQIAAWHREARELLDRAEKLGISDRVRDELLEEMKQAGLGVDGVRNRFDWSIVNGRYEVPKTYFGSLLNLQEEVQERIQNLLLADISSASDDATPPKYQDFVERYYRVLSKEGGGKRLEIRNTEKTPEKKSKSK